MRAGSGLRIGEALGLELRHVAGCTLTVEQSCWQGSLQTPKTFNALRKVDLSHDLAAALHRFIGRRKIGLMFANYCGNPMSQTNLLKRSLHPLLEECGCETMGFHALRRFRATWLRKQHAPEDLIRYWLGHANQTVTDGYSKLSEDEKFRLEVAQNVGIGYTVV